MTLANLNLSTVISIVVFINLYIYNPDKNVAPGQNVTDNAGGRFVQVTADEHYPIII